MGRLQVTYEMAEASSTTQSVELINKLMKVVGETPGVAHYSAIVGISMSVTVQQSLTVEPFSVS
jgi:HAE1 family hydrophobic/amphiphilic exporter-1